MVIIMTIDAQQLQLLLAWMSPAFPIGGFAYSHGLEFAIEDRQVTDAVALRQWIADIVERGSGWNDAVVFARCWTDDGDALNELALALAGSRERYLETTSLGNAFLLAAATWAVGGNQIKSQSPIDSPRPLGERGQGVRGFSHNDARDVADRLETCATQLSLTQDSTSTNTSKFVTSGDVAGYPSPPAPSPPRGAGDSVFRARFKNTDVAYPVAAGCL